MSSTYNRLSTETSPYLLQHASNPVNWYPWGDEAFAKANTEKKLVLVSVGYSSCHWCHVMEKEAFSDSQVAEFLNDHYICIKVDREERPDVDQIYMNAVQIITRSGGWPLNCFVLPNGKPIYGGTYFRTEQWLDILKSLYFTWQNEPIKVIEVADELAVGIANSEFIETKNPIQEGSIDRLKLYVSDWQKRFDTRYGANKGAPKFPMPGSLNFLLDYSEIIQDDLVKNHVRLTLESMRKGGIFDHIGGGFFRYSVDEHWYVPHFEKMLYDNAQLVSLYTNGYKHFGDENYRTIVYQTVDFMRRELKSADGGFFSAIDADSEGEEGKYYTFKRMEIDNILGPDAELFSVVYGVTASGNHLGKNVIREAAAVNETACLMGLEIDNVIEKLKLAKLKLLNVRGNRVRPITDDKIIVAWNALAIKALANAYNVFGDKRFLTDAIDCAQFINERLVGSEGSLNRIFCKGKASIQAFLDDYALLAQSYIALYQSTFDEEWLVKSKKLVDFAIANFFNEQSGMFFFTTSQHDNIIIRKMEITDGVIPSSNAVMAENLLFLGLYFRDNIYSDIAGQMISNLNSQLQGGGPFVYQWANNYLINISKPAEIVARGTRSNEILRTIIRESKYPYIAAWSYQMPSILPIANYEIEDNSIMVCHGTHCFLPTQNPNQVVEMLKKERPLG
jgi:hypothetical protein